MQNVGSYATLLGDDTREQGDTHLLSEFDSFECAKALAHSRENRIWGGKAHRVGKVWQWPWESRLSE